MVGTGWLGVGLVSQLVMRSFDVADKGGTEYGRRPSGEERREDTRPQPPRQKERKKEKGKKDERRVGGGRNQRSDRTCRDHLREELTFH